MVTAGDIKVRARALGFDACGIAPVADFPELQFLREWLDRGYAGDMHYMARTAARRADVRAVLPAAQSVVSLATVYHVDAPYSTERADPRDARIARYAWGDDYHAVVGTRTDALLQWMREGAGAEFEGRAYVDTGPVQERVYAQHAGLGWIGKNTCLISPDLGSWLFLSEIICTLSLSADDAALDQCGACTLCLEACPTGALPEAGVLDATRCVSYLTIELKGTMPEAQRDGVGSHVFGCDICQDVCPWNAAPAQSRTAAWRPRAAFDGPRLLDLWRRSDRELRDALAGSALTRAGVTRLRRNLAVALGNSRDPEARAALDAPDAGVAPEAPSVRDPLVSTHIEWARRKLGTLARV